MISNRYRELNIKQPSHSPCSPEALLSSFNVSLGFDEHVVQLSTLQLDIPTFSKHLFHNTAKFNNKLLWVDLSSIMLLAQAASLNTLKDNPLTSRTSPSQDLRHYLLAVDRL